MLAQIVAPRSVEDVLARIWPFQAEVFRGAPERAPQLFAAPELQSVQALVATGAPTELWWDDGGRLASAAVEPASAPALWRRGGFTLRVAGVDRQAPGLREVVELLGAELATPIPRAYANAYASAAGVATSPHFDGSEVFIAQIQGTKTWRVAPNRAVRHPAFAWSGDELEEDAARQLEAALPGGMPDDARQVRLSPGDVLFVPRGWWHAAVAGSASISLSLTFECATWLDMAMAALKRALVADPDWRRPAAGLLAPGGCAEAALQARLRGLGRDLAGLCD